MARKKGSKREQRRKGIARFLRMAGGVAEAMRYGDVEAYMNSDGIVVLRKKSRSTSLEQKIAAIQRLLAGLEKNHWISEAKKDRVREALRKKLEELQRQAAKAK